MSTKKETPVTEESKPTFSRYQAYKEDEFTFSTPELEEKIMKIVHDNSGFLTLFKQAIWYTDKFKAESNGYEWKTSTRQHNNVNGKYDIHLGLNLNQDVPDLSELPNGKYRIVIQFYNPSKRTKNRTYGCVDTKSIDFVVGTLTEAKERAYRGNEQPPASPLSQLGQLNEIGEVVNKVSDILNTSLAIHKNTMIYKDEIEKLAFDKGYKEREKEQQNEKTVNDLMARLDALENQKTAVTVPAVDPMIKALIEGGKKIGIIPADMPLENLSPEQLVNLLVSWKTGGK